MKMILSGFMPVVALRPTTQTPTEDAVSRPGSRNAWWLAQCPKHGRTAHMSIIGGRCCRCQDEGLVAQGLVKPA
jgi:hypothetical protein